MAKKNAKASKGSTTTTTTNTGKSKSKSKSKNKKKNKQKDSDQAKIALTRGERSEEWTEYSSDSDGVRVWKHKETGERVPDSLFVILSGSETPPYSDEDDNNTSTNKRNKGKKAQTRKRVRGVYVPSEWTEFSDPDGMVWKHKPTGDTYYPEDDIAFYTHGSESGSWSANAPSKSESESSSSSSSSSWTEPYVKPAPTKKKGVLGRFAGMFGGKRKRKCDDGGKGEYDDGDDIASISCE